MAGNSNPTYPQSYFQILLVLKEDGTPFSVEYPSSADAEKERLHFYNFLKWCRRPKNLNAVAHLDGRYNQVQIKRREHELLFILHTPQRWIATDDLIMKQLRAQGIEPQPLPSYVTTAKQRPLPKGEATPLRPDLLPAPLVEEHPLPMFGTEFDQRDIAAQFERLAKVPQEVTTRMTERNLDDDDNDTWMGAQR